MKKLHFYAFSFSGSDARGNSVTASAYVGYPNQLVTKTRIQAAKESAGVTSSAVLIGLGYIGFMTVEQARGRQ